MHHAPTVEVFLFRYEAEGQVLVFVSLPEGADQGNKTGLVVTDDPPLVCGIEAAERRERCRIPS
jgi:hypothetical protein